MAEALCATAMAVHHMFDSFQFGIIPEPETIRGADETEYLHSRTS